MSARAGLCLGIAVATYPEARPLFPHCTPYLQAPPGHDRIVLEVTGIGPERAAAGAQRLLSAGADAVLSWGSAAGLDPALPAGTLLLPHRVLAAAGALPVDPAWHAALQRGLSGELDIITAPLADSTTILRNAVDKAALRARSGAAAADMESAALARTTATAGIPFLVLRSIADPADGSLPRCVLGAVDTQGQLRLGTLLRALLRRPTELLPLMRVARWFGAAEQSLGRAAALQASALFAAVADGAASGGPKGAAVLNRWEK